MGYFSDGGVFFLNFIARTAIYTISVIIEIHIHCIYFLLGTAHRSHIESYTISLVKQMKNYSHTIILANTRTIDIKSNDNSNSIYNVVSD